MASKDQALILEPSGELRFKGPFTEVVTANLKLTNPTDKRICFKVKTTAPKRYCVRPNSGILEVKGSSTVAVMLQPFDYDPNEKNKHKFMVQSMFAPDHVNETQELLWKDAPPESLMDTKLKCVFELPDSSSQQPMVAENNKSVEGSANYASAVSENSFESTAIKKPDTQSPKKTALSGGDEVQKLQHDLRKTQAEVTSLKTENSQLKDEGVRLRKVAMTDTVMSTPTSSPSSSTALVSSTTFPPVVYIVIAAVIGLIIGKFIL